MTKTLILDPIWGPKTFFHELYQTWENGKKPSSGPDSGPSDPDLGTQIFFCEFYLY